MRNVGDVLEIAVRYKRLPGVNAGLAALFAVKDAFRNHDGVAMEPLLDNSANESEIVREGLADFEETSPVWAKPNCGTRWLCMHMNRERIIAVRRRNYQRLLQLISDTPGARPLFPSLSEGCAPYVFPLMVDDPDRHYQRFRASGVPIFRWDWRWPDTPVEEGDAGTKWARQIFQIGCHQDLGLDDIDAIVNTIKALLRD
ncbi:MAG: hypothetical protein WB870_07410 [Gallionellaceae bacterium]